MLNKIFYLGLAFATCISTTQTSESPSLGGFNYRTSCFPENGWFTCLIDEGTEKCMPIERACNSFNDCEDHSDEGGMCNSTAINCNFIDCPDDCKQTPAGPVCQCPLGFRFDGKTCIDIDECSVKPPMCSQNCVNSLGAFQCSCISGYSLNDRNNRNCIANGPEAMLLISTNHDIRTISLTSNEHISLIQAGTSPANSVTSYYEDEFIFWTEKSREKAGIFKSLLDGSAQQYVVSVGVETVEDLTIDWIGRHIYFTDSGRKHIVACDIHGNLCSVVVTGQLDKPRGIAVYPEERLLFWSDWGSRPHIGSSGMDGSRRKDIILTDIAMPNSLAVDETIQRIFWSDTKLSRIESSRLDGSDRIILPVTVNHPYAIDVFEDLIYWSDSVANEVLSCNKFSGDDVKVLMANASLTPTGVHIHHPSTQRPISSPCLNEECSHLCLLSPSASGFQCGCPHGMTLNSNNRTCDLVIEIQSSLVIATSTDLYHLRHHYIGRDSMVHLPIRNLENIGALSFNPSAHSIVYSDTVGRIIYSMNLESYNETVLFENVGAVEGLSVDPYTENIYWTEVSKGTVMVGHVNQEGVGQRITLAKGLHSPKSITLAPELGLMFIVEGRSSDIINVWFMDGSVKEKLVQVYGMVSAMAYDGNKRLYFSDSLRGTIEHIGIDGQNRTILRSYQGYPIAIGVTSDSLFWLTLNSSRLNWLSKQEPKTTRGFMMHVDGTEPSDQYYRMMSVIEQFGYEDDHACLSQTFECSDICAPTPNGAKCLCPLGKELSDDLHSCTLVNCTGPLWFKCQTECIPSNLRCNGIQDCPTGEDEIGCQNEVSTCSPLQFQCGSGRCISNSLLCDGNYDCEDKSDEPDTCTLLECDVDEIVCLEEGKCIEKAEICNGQADCSDGSDELNCTTTTSHPVKRNQSNESEITLLDNISADATKEIAIRGNVIENLQDLKEGWVTLMATLISNLVKENEHQNKRISLLEDKKRDQDEQIETMKSRQVRNAAEDMIRLLRDQLARLESIMSMSFYSEPFKNSSISL